MHHRHEQGRQQSRSVSSTATHVSRGRRSREYDVDHSTPYTSRSNTNAESPYEMATGAAIIRICKHSKPICNKPRPVRFFQNGAFLARKSSHVIQFCEALVRLGMVPKKLNGAQGKYFHPNTISVRCFISHLCSQGKYYDI